MAATRYNLQNIRILLLEGFTDEELRQFCYDTPDFRSVYDQLPRDSDKDRIVSLLLEHAEQRLLFEHLLAWAQERNPSAYARYQPYSVEDSANAPPRSPEAAQTKARRVAKVPPAPESIDVSQTAVHANEPSSSSSLPERPEEKIVDGMANDRPKGEDRLGYTAYAKAFAQVLTSKHTNPPLTIGIYAAWGMGKSFLLSKIKAEIEAIQRAYEQERRQRSPLVKLRDWLYRRRPVLRSFSPPDEEVGWLQKRYRQLFGMFARPPAEEIDEFLFIDFNAWVYSGSENLWAGLITKLYSEVEKYFGQWRTSYFRLGQTFRRSLRRIIGLLAVYGLLAIALSLLLDYSAFQTNFSNLQASWDSFKAAFTTVAGITAIIGSALAAALPLFRAIQELFSSLVLARSEQLRNLSSRRDFRDKIGFMADIKEEIGQISRLVKQGHRGRSMRLVIFIDDLDRCPPAKAVDVLEAIMLLLADEDGAPFIVFLGLDARIIVKAIEERYGKVLTEAGITGYEYLDKIVQIPFRIPPAGEEALKGYVNSLLWRSEAERKKAEEAEKQSQLAETDAGEVAAPSSPLVERPPVSAERPSIEVSFRKEERDAFAKFTPFLSPNPRRVKRIVNIYRIVRLLEPKAMPECLIKWIILSEQWPYRTAWLMEQIENDFQTNGPFSREIHAPLKQVFDVVKSRVEAKAAEVFASLDADRELFDKFITTEPILSVADVQAVRQFTFNLNPALQEDVFKTAYKTESDKTLGNAPKTDGKTPRKRVPRTDSENGHSLGNSTKVTARKRKTNKTKKDLENIPLNISAATELSS